MNKLRVEDLYSLEEYHRIRPDFRAKVLAHKRDRQLPIGPNATLYFEDQLTMQYQVQEMLRIERIFESEAIEEELSAYNPLIPDGTNLKATFMVEFPDPDDRREALIRMKGVEDRVWLRVGDGEPVHGIADEDLDRSNEEKTSAVHFMRFEFDDAMCSALKSGAPMTAGIDHPAYDHTIDVPEATRRSLTADLAG